jgi:anoctamin-1
MTGVEVENKGSIFCTQWAKDVKLLEWGPRSLFPEYLEMVLQYGFVTIFVAAFPLAPLFALLNNILEMRLDAKKLITYYRRPVSQRVKDIGVWYGIMDAIGKIAVISNAFIIAFTSNFIPKLVYMYDNDGTLDGYLNHSLAYFNVSEFRPDQQPMNTSFNKEVEVCRYQQYRTSHLEPNGLKYKRTYFYWKVWMARLAFVVVFENVVALCVMTLKWIIPDIPKKLNDKIKRETYLTNEIIIKQEMQIARGGSRGDGGAWNPVSGDKELELVRSPSVAGNATRKRYTNEPKDSESAEVMV